MRSAPFGAFRSLGLQLAAALANTVADIAYSIQPAHILLLQEIDCVGIAFREKRHQNIGTRYGVFARCLYVQDGALNNPLEPCRGLWIGIIICLKRLIFLVEILFHNLGQLGQIDPASRHHLRAILVIDQCQQQMLQRGIFMPTL